MSIRAFVILISLWRYERYFTQQTAINADGKQIPLSTMVRVYQLSDRKNVDAA